MKPPSFQYCAPRILDEALYLLDAYNGDVKALAGGQSFVPLLNMRLAGPAYIVDINHIPELHYLEAEQDYLTISDIYEILMPSHIVECYLTFEMLRQDR
jgi:CO/xanthine dehydrogenase FAD-binding subunit